MTELSGGVQSFLHAGFTDLAPLEDGDELRGRFFNENAAPLLELPRIVS